MIYIYIKVRIIIIIVRLHHAETSINIYHFGQMTLKIHWGVLDKSVWKWNVIIIAKNHQKIHRPSKYDSK